MTMTDARNVVGEATAGELQAAVRGQVIRPGDNDYDEARAIWNATHDKYPALIVRCAGTADVIKTVEFARSQGLPLAVRGGAHSIAGFSTSDGGVVLDLSLMNAVRVDPRPAALSRRAGLPGPISTTRRRRSAWPSTGGLVSTTGLGGFTLGGGIGWLLRKHGLTCDNLVSADVVTAEGASGPCQRRAEQRPVLGVARRRRQFRRRHRRWSTRCTRWVPRSSAGWFLPGRRRPGRC